MTLMYHSTFGMLLFFMSATIAGSQYTKVQNAWKAANPNPDAKAQEAALKASKAGQGIGICVITFFWLHGVAYALAWSGLLVAYTVEVLPFKLRAKGLVLMNVAVQLALVINNQVNPIPMGP
jgi:hypothetical protein